MKLTRGLKLVSMFCSFLTLSGGATAGFGIWSQINSKMSEAFKTAVDTAPTMILSVRAPVLIALGVIFALMGLIGFCGTLKKKSWILLVVVFHLIIFILQIVAAVFIYLPNSVKENALSSLEANIVKNLQNHYKKDSKFMNIWDETMNQLKCCGYKGYNDFTNSSFVKTNSNYPTQCCDPKTDSNSNCTKEEAGNKKVRGCFHVLLDVSVSAPLTFLITILEIVALVVSLKAYRCIRHLPDLPDPFGNNL